jgi:predicted metal-binding protein
MNKNNLEGCLFNEYKSDMRQYTKYMGFYYCGECNNSNTNEYCSKNIQGKNYNFYYLYGQSDLSFKKRQCFWSNNNSNFIEYEFINNLEDNINYYK